MSQAFHFPQVSLFLWHWIPCSWVWYHRQKVKSCHPCGGYYYGWKEQKSQMLPWRKPCLGMGILTWAYPHLEREHPQAKVLIFDLPVSSTQFYGHFLPFHRGTATSAGDGKKLGLGHKGSDCDLKLAFLKNFTGINLLHKGHQSLTVDLPLRKPWYKLAKRIFAKPSTDCAVSQQYVKNYNNETGNCVHAYSVFYGLF